LVVDIRLVDYVKTPNPYQDITGLLSTVQLNINGEAVLLLD